MREYAPYSVPKYVELVQEKLQYDVLIEFELKEPLLSVRMVLSLIQPW